MTAPVFIGLAWAVELLFGWPKRVHRHVGHPVVWLGHLIYLLDRTLNLDSWPGAVRYASGVIATVGSVCSVIALALIIDHLTRDVWWGVAIEVVIASSLIASRSLFQHVSAVAVALTCGQLEAARAAVAMIVGRETNQLDEIGVSRASLESLAENASDGVIAPIFWGALCGLPGLAAYKAINTLDSMIGHRNDRHAQFGGFAARLDDVVNVIPARITGVLIVLASGKLRPIRTLFQDARKHCSPNAGWPEAAMAGALNVRLSGPRVYQGAIHDEPWLNEAGKDADANALRAGLSIYQRAMALAAVLLAVIAIATFAMGWSDG